nr:FIST N-terminal domain-containing protein [uncultured Carboxylicivirga sp.]
MKVQIAYSQHTDIENIVADLKNQIDGFDTKLIQFFASSNINPEKISEKLYDAYGNVPIMGCTTSGEILSGKILDNSIVMMAMGSEIVDDCKIEVLTNIQSNILSVEKAFASFESYFGTKVSDLDTEKYVGLVLIDGLSGQEEKINERIGDLTNVSFIGGSAGDDLKFEQTHVFANGKAYSNAAVIALLKCNTEFDILKTQSFKTTNQKVEVTKADELTRTIIELNGRPAVEEYTALVGVDKANVAAAFARKPVGLVAGDDFFVRSPQKTDGNNLVFYCSVKEGMKLDVLESQDIVEDTQKDLKAKMAEFGSVSAILNINCILRTLELKEKKQTDAYAELFENVPTIGFSSYGESYIGHINQTAVMLLFK